MNTVLGLLAKGDMNCAGDEIGTDLFSNSAEKPVAAEQHKAPRNPNETAGKGVVLTAAEKRLLTRLPASKKNWKKLRQDFSQKKKPKKKKRDAKKTVSSINDERFQEVCERYHF